MDFRQKMRNEVIEDVSKKLKVKPQYNMIFMAVGWDEPYYSQRDNFVEAYWKHFLSRRPSERD